jgi:hypothetical protein
MWPQFFRNAPGFIFDKNEVGVVLKNFSQKTTFVSGKIKNTNLGGEELISKNILFEFYYYSKYPTQFSESKAILVVLRNFSFPRKCKSTNLGTKSRDVSVMRIFYLKQNLCLCSSKQNLIGYIPKNFYTLKISKV